MNTQLSVTGRCISINHEGLYYWRSQGETKTTEPTMTRPRSNEIDPMVPELAAATDRTDGGSRVASDGGVARAAETDAPLVPDLT
jgi:hypothetical protein